MLENPIATDAEQIAAVGPARGKPRFFQGRSEAWPGAAGDEGPSSRHKHEEIDHVHDIDVDLSKHPHRNDSIRSKFSVI
jgi:hypothetical protein